MWWLLLLAVSSNAYRSMAITKIGFLKRSEVNRMCMHEHSSWSIPMGIGGMASWYFDGLLLCLQLCQKLQKESQLEYCVQEPNEALCTGEDGPPMLIHMDVGAWLGIINYLTSWLEKVLRFFFLLDSTVWSTTQDKMK